MHCDPLERFVWDTGSISGLHRPRLDVAQLAHGHLPREPARRPTDLPVPVEVAEEVPDVRVARLDPGHLRGAVGSRREQGHVFQCGCADIVVDECLKVRMLLSRRRLGVDVRRRHSHESVQALPDGRCDEVEFGFLVLLAARPLVHFDPWLFQVRVEDPALALGVERLITVDLQSGLESVHLVFEETRPDIDQNVEDEGRRLHAAPSECSTGATGPRPGNGLLVLPVGVLLLVPPPLVLPKLRRLDPDPALLGVHQLTKPNHPHHVSLRNRVNRGACLLMSQCPSLDVIKSIEDRCLVVHDAVWGGH
jgi:hypothetical protein